MLQVQIHGGTQRRMQPYDLVSLVGSIANSLTRDVQLLTTLDNQVDVEPNSACYAAPNGRDVAVHGSITKMEAIHGGITH